MKRNRRVDASVQCPYYKSDGRQAVYCEGVEEDSGLRLGFGAHLRKQQYKDSVCCDRWKTCAVAQMLNRKYDYEA